ncbi:MAG: hypothetical protein K8Q91_01535 [Candidatus Vogelbacteria bacterium]|nr:hypothetical protein [Candidatus Vogelbacteria bacterium]
MFWFTLKALAAIALIVGAKFLRKMATDPEREAEETRYMRIGSRVLYPVAALVMFWAFIGTSMVWVPAGEIMTLNRVYLGKSLPPGRIVALAGELGPQARILTPGFHFEMFLTLTHKVDYEEVLNVPNGQCALMSAKDGAHITGGSAFAQPWTDAEKMLMANDATHFLTEGKGQRGPQTTVLTPGMYTINPHLWAKPEIIPATRIEQGTVGVVKSSVLAAVDFGAFKREAPKDGTLKVLGDQTLPIGRAKALLVPVGAIGVWEEPLPNGLYYINTAAYKITHVPTIAQVYEYKGGYTRRTVDVSVDDQGKIVEKLAEKEIQPVPEAADTAIFAKPEGWDVPQELRVMVQISPDRAPFVAAALGLTGDNTSEIIENRVVTPVIRSVVRDVLGGAQIPFKQQRAVLGTDGKPIIDEKTGEPKTELVHEFRPVKVMDLLENRPSLEEAMEQRARTEAEKEGVMVMEVLLSESSIPSELLIARKREQLAQQLMKAWVQEEMAQTQRQATENARATAEQQPELVKAEILAKAAENRAQARETEAKGEQAYLLALAEGQQAQAEVLGKEMTAQLQMFQQGLKAITEIMEKNPELLTSAIENAKKFVPDVVVNNGAGGGNNLEGAAAVFGHLLNRPTEQPAEAVTQ